MVWRVYQLRLNRRGECLHRECRPPLGYLGLKISGELLRRGTDLYRTEILHPFLDRWLGEDSDRIGMKSCDHFMPSLGGWKQSPPWGDLEARQAGFRQRRQLRCCRHPLGRRYGKSARVAGAQQLERGYGKHDVDVSCNEILLGARAIGHMGHFNASHALEQLAA
jgi:hypothetical protein